MSNISFEIDWKCVLFLIVSPFVFYICVSATVSHTSVDSDFLRIQYTQRNFNSTTSSLQILSCLSEKETLSVTCRVWNTSAFSLVDGHEFCDPGQRRHQRSWVLSSCEETTNMIDWWEDDAIRTESYWRWKKRDRNRWYQYALWRTCQETEEFRRRRT